MNTAGLCRTLDSALGLIDGEAGDQWWSTDEWCEELTAVTEFLAGGPGTDFAVSADHPIGPERTVIPEAVP